MVTCSAPSDEAQELFQKAVSAMQKNDLAQAVDCVQSALALSPRDGRFWRALGELHAMQGLHAKALLAFEQALAVQGPSPEIYFSMATALDSLGRRDEASQLFSRATRSAPEWPEAWFNLGVVLLQLSRPEAALGALQQALALRPGWMDAWFNLGAAADQLGINAQAQLCWEQVLSQKPDHLQALMNLGIVHLRQEHLDAAETLFREALRHEPQSAKAYMHLGLCHQRRKRTEEAVVCYRRALDIDPNYADAWFNLADVLRQSHRWDELIDCYARVITLNPKNAAAHLNLAISLRRKGLIAEALMHCHLARSIDPAFSEAIVYQLQLAQHACDWTLVEQLTPIVDQLSARQISQGQKPTESPMLNLRRDVNPQQNLAIAKAWSHWIEKSVQQKSDSPCFTHHGRTGRRMIRIGYISNDFKEHAVAHHLFGLLRNHHRERFRICLYACNPEDNSPYRRKLAQACDHFIEMDRLSDRAAAQRIHDDRIDILVDLMGHTQGGRLEILARRPAPVQVSYLGFLGSTGASFIDYFVTDRVATPPDQAIFYTEKLVYLPGCYQVNDDQMPIAEGASRPTLGLKQDRLVLCCFNQAYKIDRRCFQAWLTILNNIPQAVLWLLYPNATAEANLLQAATQAGVAADRIIFARPTRIDHHLGRLRQADMALDTFIYNGGATTANALWAGVPVLTMAGNHLVSRMSASALTAVGLPEMITSSVEQYVQRATDLLSDRTRLSNIRAKLEKQRSGSSLFNPHWFSCHLEAAFEQMIVRFDAGIMPTSFSIESEPKTVLV